MRPISFKPLIIADIEEDAQRFDIFLGNDSLFNQLEDKTSIIDIQPQFDIIRRFLISYFVLFNFFREDPLEFPTHKIFLLANQFVLKGFFKIFQLWKGVQDKYQECQQKIVIIFTIVISFQVRVKPFYDKERINCVILVYLLKILLIHTGLDFPP